MRRGVVFGCKCYWDDIKGAGEREPFVPFYVPLSFRCQTAPGLVKVGNPCKVQ